MRAILTAIALTTLKVVAAGTFTVLHFPGSSNPWGLNAISGDGTTVAGRGTGLSGSGEVGWIWSRKHGYEFIEEGNSKITALSHDGSMAAGDGESERGREAFRWHRNGGLEWLGDLPPSRGTYDNFYSVGYSMSADGEVVSGESKVGNSYTAYIWTSSIGMEELVSAHWNGGVWDLSANGEVGVGSFYSQATHGTHGFRWESDGTLTDYGPSYRPGAVSANGVISVGSAYRTIDGTTVQLAGRMGDNEMLEYLGDLPGGREESLASDVSSDGRLVVGESMTDDYFEAFIWTAEGGMQKLSDYLRSQGVNIGEETVLIGAPHMSDDGLSFAGLGQVEGEYVYWHAVIPEPSTFFLVLFSLVVITRRKR